MLHAVLRTINALRRSVQAIVFVDDVNMPAVEKYGAQPPVELLRQLIDNGGLYDRRKRFWKAVEDTSMIVAAAPPAGGRNSLTPRFVRHFALFCMPPPSRVGMQRIFTSILSGFLEPFTPDVRARCSEAVNATVEVRAQFGAPTNRAGPAWQQQFVLTPLVECCRCTCA